jgi:Tol biopolymer transport system component
MTKRSATTSLAATVLLGAIAIACRESAPPAPTKLYEVGDNAWYEGNVTRLDISPDGHRALFGLFRKRHLVDLTTGEEDQTTLAKGLDQVGGAVFCGPTIILRDGLRGTDRGWFLPQGDQLQLIPSLPEDAVITCNADGKSMAYYRAGQPRAGVFVGQPPDFKNYPLDGDASAAAFTPDGSKLLATSINDAGVSSLVEITIGTGANRSIAKDLDMMPGPNTIGVSSDGRHIYLALASAGAPDNAARHQPMAMRYLQIYELDATTGARRSIVATDQDNYDPNVVDGYLYWSRVLTHKAVAVIPATGGQVREIMEGADLPMWSPDARRISYTYDRDRMADGALPMDVGVISVDSGANRTSEPAAFVTGYHEDFTAAWSPDGHWIAWHSHRPPTPVPFYESPGHTDDIYLRIADDTKAPELRLTDFGWEVGPAYWAPDGRRLLFSGWLKGGTPFMDRLWIATIDPKSGKLLHADLLPLPAGMRSTRWAIWSPDGKAIAVEDDQGDGKRILWVMRPDGSHARKLTDYTGNTYGALDWSPDGKSIIYTGLADGRNQLFTIPSAGGTPQQFTRDPANVLHPRFSPNGHWIAVSHLEKSHQIWREKL